jgi:hypothetical protein
MKEKETASRKEEEQTEHSRGERTSPGGEQPHVEETEHPVPGVKHEKEPDAENMMPAQDRPGTF